MAWRYVASEHMIKTTVSYYSDYSGVQEVADDASGWSSWHGHFTWLTAPVAGIRMYFDYAGRESLRIGKGKFTTVWSTPITVTEDGPWHFQGPDYRDRVCVLRRAGRIQRFAGVRDPTPLAPLPTKVGGMPAGSFGPEC